jgi:hypothetical protein
LLPPDLQIEILSDLNKFIEISQFQNVHFGFTSLRSLRPPLRPPTPEAASERAGPVKLKIKAFLNIFHGFADRIVQ